MPVSVYVCVLWMHKCLRKSCDIVHRSMSRITMDLQQHFLAIRASSSSSNFFRSFTLHLLSCSWTKDRICTFVYICITWFYYAPAIACSIWLLEYTTGCLDSYKEIVNCRPISFSRSFDLSLCVFFTTVNFFFNIAKYVFAGKRWVCIIFRIFFIYFRSLHFLEQSRCERARNVKENRHSNKQTNRKNNCIVEILP